MAPRLNGTQLAWLQEAGIDRRLLLYWQAADAPVPSVPAVAVPAQPQPAAKASMEHEGRRQTGPDTTSRTAIAKPRSRAPDTSISKAQAAHQVADDWDALREQVAGCALCSLHAGRNLAVFGEGAVESVDWMLIGEAPGDRDDRKGLPFQGKAGDLLQAMLKAAGVDPQANVYYTNVLKCRPRGGRMPAADEIASCLPYLHRQIALLKPARILALGKLAAEALLNSQEGLESLRGGVHTYVDETGHAIPLVATYHPASLLLQPRQKAAAWADLLRARLL